MKHPRWCSSGFVVYKPTARYEHALRAGRQYIGRAIGADSAALYPYSGSAGLSFHHENELKRPRDSHGFARSRPRFKV